MLIAAVMLCSTSAFASTVTIDFSNSTGAKINFPGNNTFFFTPNGSSDTNFTVTDGTAAGLLGRIDGTYTIGTVSGPDGGGTSTANVTGSGTFNIFDGANTLTGSLTWVDISQKGTGSTLDVSGQVNLTGITYGGSNADLVALASNTSGITVLTFQFTPPKALSVLRSHTDGTYKTSFSGTVTATPEPSAIALLGAGLLMFVVVGRRKLYNN